MMVRVSKTGKDDRIVRTIISNGKDARTIFYKEKQIFEAEGINQLNHGIIVSGIERFLQPRIKAQLCLRYRVFSCVEIANEKVYNE
jgi:hypothetical protein